MSNQGGVVMAYFKATEVLLWAKGRARDRYEETSLDRSRWDKPHPIWESIDDDLRAAFQNWESEALSTLRWQNLAQGNQTTGDSFEVSAALFRIGICRMLRVPWSTATCCVARMESILTFPLNIAVSPSSEETGRVRNFAVGAAYLLLALAAALTLILRHGWRTSFAFWATLALLLATTPQVDPRFRVPMIPMLLVLALAGKSSQERAEGESGGFAGEASPSPSLVSSSSRSS